MNAKAELLAALSAIAGTGNFHATGHAAFFDPRLKVAGVGPVEFPLSEEQAKKLISKAEAAPFGMGTQTVLDEKVRKCWQMDASAFSFHSLDWIDYLRGVLNTIREDLGISEAITAFPYKLLLYGKGGHFKAHKDTEKLDAMFGSLIIALPSPHKGGRLLIRHDGKKAAVNFSAAKHSKDFQYAAFFADCEHEVEPVVSGHRLCVAYNLRLEKGNPAALNPANSERAEALVPALRKLRATRPGKLSVVVLEHSYTESNMSLQSLKGNDRARAQALFATAPEAGFSAFLALLTLERSGEWVGAYDRHYRRNRRSSRRFHDDDKEDEGDDEIGEIYSESFTLSHWRDAQDKPIERRPTEIEEADIISKETIANGSPDHKESEGYTGNAGCTMDHWYWRAAIVLWAAEDEDFVLCKQDLAGACARLQLLAKKKETAPGSPFHRLASAAISLYPEKFTFIGFWRDYSDNPLRSLMQSLVEGKAADLMETLLQRLPEEAFIVCEPPLWTKMLKAFGANAFDALIAKLLQSEADHARPPLYQILAILGKAEAATQVQKIIPHLVGLGHQPLEESRRSAFFSHLKKSSSEHSAVTEIKTLLAVSHLLVKPAQQKPLDKFLRSDGTLAYIRKTLGPALTGKGSAEFFKNPNSLAPALRTFACGILKAEVARPILPFTDWKRPCPAVSNRGSFSPAKILMAYRELEAFMADATAQKHQFTYTVEIRKQIASFITAQKLDLEYPAITKGPARPLDCTKTDMSYQQAMEQREKDHAMLQVLDAG